MFRRGEIRERGPLHRRPAARGRDRAQITVEQSRHVHDRLHAQASVMLTISGRQTLSPEAVQSVVDLVAAGVPGLRPQDVTVVDSNLHLLFRRELFYPLNYEGGTVIPDNVPGGPGRRPGTP